MEEEEIEEEVVAVQSVYSEGQCQVLNRRPPLLHVSLKPRTADDISQQFVEAVLVIKASMQYPEEPPQLELKDTKGLDERRCLQLLNELRLLAEELASCPMLVFLCEAATDKLTSLNQPEGNCCFCMFPLMMEDDAKSGSRPFMKLLSCFHCFHSDCFGRWWRWLQHEQDISHPSTTSITSHEKEEHVEEPGSSMLSEEAVLENLVNKLKAKCPVCRIPILATDISHVLHFLTADTTAEQSDNLDKEEIAELLSTEEELARRKYFAEKITSQEARGGIIEPKKLEVILPGMYVSSAVNSLMSEAGGSHHSSVENLNDYPNSVKDDEEHCSASHNIDIPISEAQVIDCEQDASARKGSHLQNASTSLRVDVVNNALNTDEGETVRVHLNARARNTNGHVPKEGRHYRQNTHANTGKQKAIWIKREKKG